MLEVGVGVPVIRDQSAALDCKRSIGYTVATDFSRIDDVDSINCNLLVGTVTSL